MKDATLHLEGYLPNGGGTLTLSPMDLGVDTASFSDNWRQGRLRVTLASAMPNFTNNANTITVTLQDSGDYGNTYQQTNPLIQPSFTGVANGTAALAYVDAPLPPGLRGPIALAISVPNGVNTNDVNGNPVLITADWLNE